MPRSLLAPWLFVAGLAACYQPSYAGPYICDPKLAGTDCPDGWNCVDRLCVPPGTPMPDMSMRPTCANQGSLLAMARGGQVWACPGTFAAGAYASVCATLPGSHVCGGELRDDMLLMLLDCDSVTGFYMAQFDVGVARDIGTSMYEAQCDTQPGGGLRAILGCGTMPGVTRLGGPDCHSLHHALLCPANSDWTCTPQASLSDVAHTATTSGPGGVLCCISEVH
jgi:hypothetical protein